MEVRSPALPGLRRSALALRRHAWAKQGVRRPGQQTPRTEHAPKPAPGPSSQRAVRARELLAEGGSTLPVAFGDGPHRKQRRGPEAIARVPRQALERCHRDVCILVFAEYILQGRDALAETHGWLAIDRSHEFERVP